MCVQRISLTATDFLSNSSVGCKQNIPVAKGHINHQHLYIKFFWGYTSTECKRNSVISKSAYLSCIPNTTKSQNLNKYKKEQTITETKNVRVEIIALKSFVVD